MKTPSYKDGLWIELNKESVEKFEEFYMEPNQSQSPQIITIYKAPQKCKGQKLLKEGFQPVDFPYNPPYVDGNCYFAGPRIEVFQVVGISL